MPTSSYMPNVVVEIAWGSGYATPAASRTWTDVSAYVELGEGITIGGGRQNERSTADANLLRLVLDNSDGRFTAGLASSPYYPNVKLDVPIRVRADPVDGADSIRFLGFINEWPVEWNGTGAYASASITASSRISRLGYTAGLKSLPEIAILADSPLAYYTLGEPSGATQANDSSGANAPPLLLTGDPALPVVFGTATGPGTDSLTAATFASGVNPGQYLYGGGGPANASGTLEMFFSTDAVPTWDMGLATDTSSAVSLVINTSGHMELWIGATTLLTASANVCDGATHHVAAVTNSSSAILYVDGVNVASVGSGTVYASFGTLWVGAANIESTFASPITGFTGTLAHVARYGAYLSAGQVLAHATAGLTGYAGETVDDRFDRYVGYAGIPVADVNAETSTILVQHLDTTDKQILDLLRTLEGTEGGVLYDERDGTLTLHNRGHRYNVASAFTLDMNEQEVEAGYQPLLDRTYILNDVSVKDVSGTYSARKTDPTSLSSYGPMTATVETADIDDDAPLMTASWLVATYKDPRVRVASCGVDVLAQVGKSPNSATVLAATVGTKITVSNHPAQAASSSATYFVEGWTEVYGPESLQVTWNLSPTSPWDQTLIIGDGSRGFIGTNPIAY